MIERELLARVEFFASRRRATGTARVYASHWRGWEAFAVERHLPTLPAVPAHVAAYLAHLDARGLTVATISVALAAITARHREAGAPLGVQAEISAVSQGIARTRGRRPPPRHRAVLLEELARIIPRGRSLLELRDRALLALGWSAALRRSELVALRVEDVTILPGKGLAIRIRRSKTDQLGDGATVAALSLPDAHICPAASLADWLDAAGITRGPIFRRLHGSGRLIDGSLVPGHVAKVIKRRAEAAGVEDVDRLAAHSLRSGFATEAGRRGARPHEIARVTRHVNTATTEKYIREPEAFAAHPLAGRTTSDGKKKVG